MTTDEGKIKDAVESAARAMREEAAAVARLEPATRSEEFATALKICIACEGIVYVIGMGKSGLVGQKISATLASTGTPSLCIHAGDALHGDIGSVRPGDVAILISKSGETREVLQCVPFLKRQGVPMIAISAEPSSSLARAANVNLDIAVADEACPMNLAPMTSSTATMAIGDALAAALITAKGFTPAEFALRHPAGKLGWLLTAKVADMIDKSRNPVMTEGAPLRQAVAMLMEFRLGGVNVTTEDGRLVGVLTDGDLKRVLFDGGVLPLDKPVREFMKRDPITAPLSASAAEALDLMENRESQISVLPVADADGRPVGLLRLHDVIKSHL